MLEEKYPEPVCRLSSDGDMSMPAGSDMSMPARRTSKHAEVPRPLRARTWTGTQVKSDELFSGNAVTVVNFWFTTCNPCVGELAELDALNKELAKKGGTLIGVNTSTLDGDESGNLGGKGCADEEGRNVSECVF